MGAVQNSSGYTSAPEVWPPDNLLSKYAGRLFGDKGRLPLFQEEQGQQQQTDSADRRRCKFLLIKDHPSLGYTRCNATFFTTGTWLLVLKDMKADFLSIQALCRPRALDNIGVSFKKWVVDGLPRIFAPLC